MRGLSLSVVVLFSLGLATAHALTVDEIVKLKQAGVGDATIELLIESEGTSRVAGVWRTKDGWIVHTTDTRAHRPGSDQGYYPMVMTPQVFVGANKARGGRAGMTQ